MYLEHNLLNIRTKDVLKNNCREKCDVHFTFSILFLLCHQVFEIITAYIMCTFTDFKIPQSPQSDHIQRLTLIICLFKLFVHLSHFINKDNREYTMCQLEKHARVLCTFGLGRYNPVSGRSILRVCGDVRDNTYNISHCFLILLRLSINYSGRFFV